MAIGTEEQLADTAVRARELAVGEMVTFKSGQGIREIIFGRDPEVEYEGRPVNIGPGILPVKLDGAALNTSRQQFGIGRDGNGPFILTNYSKTTLQVENGHGERFALAPNISTTLAKNTQEMQRAKIGWQRYYEVSVQGIGTDSGDKDWNVDFKWSLVGLK
jgi:hypothetical protein